MKRKYRNTVVNHQKIHVGKATKYYIYIDGIGVEVVPEVYQAYASSIRKEMYFEEQYDSRRYVSLEDCAVTLFNNVSATESAEDKVMQLISIQQANEMLSKLEDSEKELLYLLFVKRQTHREIGKFLGICHTTVMHRKNKLLKKLTDFQ